MARWPAPGRCKRRLANDLDRMLRLPGADERAAKLQRRLIVHTMAVAMDLSRTDHLEVVLAVSGLGPRAAARWGRKLQADHTLLQRGRGLGCRMRHLLLQLQQSNAGGPALLIGSDLPTLCRSALREAIDRLQQHDLVLGVAEDGGYWLIGLTASLLRQPELWPLGGISWGKDIVLRQTMEQARAAGLDVGLLPSQQDLDHLQDLQPWLA